MPKIRVMAGKPNHQGAYSQGRKLGKQRNHTHQFETTFNTKGQTIEYCTVPTCKKHRLINGDNS